MVLWDLLNGLVVWVMSSCLHHLQWSKGHQVCPGTVRERAVRVLLPKVRESRMLEIPGGRMEIKKSWRPE